MSEKNGSSAGKPDVDALRAEIKQTRADLGETVQALAAKADVKARAKEQVEQTKQKVKAQAAEAGTKVRDVAVAATDKVRQAAAQAGASARGVVAEVGDKAQSDKAQSDKAQSDKAQRTTEQVRNPIPVAAVLVGVVAVIGVILIFRGRRR